MSKMNAFNVSLNGKWIDTVFYNDGITKEEVKESLINHDGFDHNIKVTKERKKKEKLPENVLGYFVDSGEVKSASTVFVAINEAFTNEGHITAYTPIGQHSALSMDYLKDCTRITKEEYLEYSHGIYTPEEYL